MTQFAEATERLIEWHADGGHAWLKVPLELVEPFKDRISNCSYRDFEFAYLEEDCDAGVFLTWYFDFAGIELFMHKLNQTGRFIDDGSSSPIRRLPRFDANLTISPYLGNI